MVIGVVHVPAAGHLRPLRVVTDALAARGHRVVAWVAPEWADQAAGPGVEVRPLPLPAGFDPAQPPDALVELVALLGRAAGLLTGPLALELADAGVDVVLHDSMAPWGRAAAAARGLPTVTSTSTFAVGRGFPPLRALPALAGSSLVSPRRLLQVRRSVRASGAGPGLLGLLSNPGDRTLVYTSEELQPARHRYDATYAFVGPLLGSAHEDEPALAEVDAGDPLFYVALGTLRNDRTDFYRSCFDAFAGQPCTVLMSVGERADLRALGDPPPNVLVRRHVVQRAVLARSSLFVTHAGMNSVHEALVAGVPMLCVPQSGDQHVVAARLAQLGAGRVLRRPDAARLRARTRDLLQDPLPARRAQELGATLLAAGGPPLAVAVVEDLLERTTGSNVRRRPPRPS